MVPLGLAPSMVLPKVASILYLFLTLLVALPYLLFNILQNSNEYLCCLAVQTGARLLAKFLFPVLDFIPQTCDSLKSENDSRNLLFYDENMNSKPTALGQAQTGTQVLMQVIQNHTKFWSIFVSLEVDESLKNR